MSFRLCTRVDTSTLRGQTRACHDGCTEGALPQARPRLEIARSGFAIVLGRGCASRLGIARSCSRATPAVLANSRRSYTFAAGHMRVYQLGTLLVSAVFDLRLGVVAEIELLLPAIGLFPDTPHPAT